MEHKHLNLKCYGIDLVFLPHYEFDALDFGFISSELGKISSLAVCNAKFPSLCFGQPGSENKWMRDSRNLRLPF